MSDQTTGKTLTAFHLKCIALIAMVIDHIAAVLILDLGLMGGWSSPLYYLLRGIGRIAFPVYAFLIAEGCRHTRSREKYLLRLGLFALVSQIPFVLAFYPQFFSERLWRNFLDDANVFYTLFFAVACIHIWETLRRRSRPLRLAAAGFFGACVALWACLLFNGVGNALPFILMIIVYLACFLAACHVLAARGGEIGPDWPGSLLCILPLLPVFFLAEVVDCDYSVFGVVLICLIYLAKSRRLQVGVLTLGVLYEYGWEGWLKRTVLLENPFRPEGAVNLCFALLAAALVCLYNGQRGRNVRWAFYAAYPAHIAVLAGLRMILRP